MIDTTTTRRMSVPINVMTGKPWCEICNTFHDPGDPHGQRLRLLEILEQQEDTVEMARKSEKRRWILSILAGYGIVVFLTGGWIWNHALVYCQDWKYAKTPICYDSVEKDLFPIEGLIWPVYWSFRGAIWVTRWP